MKTNHRKLYRSLSLPLLSAFALSAVFGASASQAANLPFFSDPTLPPQVRQAHEDFLKGDFSKMLADIEAALVAYPGDSAVQSDLLELYDQALELKGPKALKPDWKAPGGVDWLVATSQAKYRANSGRTGYRMSFGMNFPKEKVLAQFRVVHYPSQVIVDRKAGVGETEVTLEDGKQNLWIAQDYRNEHNANGLYLLDIQFEGEKEPTHGYFLLSRMNASATPGAQIPTLNQVFTTKQLSFSWDDFVTPEYRKFETRKVVATLVAENADDNAWMVSESAPFTHATVDKPLPAGKYAFQVHVKERHAFGDMMIQRQSTTQIPIEIK